MNSRQRSEWQWHSGKKTIKIICVGPVSAGKTSLIRRYVLDAWTDVRFSTRGVDFLSKRIPNPLNDGDECVTVQLFDTAGQERFGTTLSPSFFKKADGALLLYDATSRNSFKDCVRWYHILREKMMSNEEEGGVFNGRIHQEDSKQMFESDTSRSNGSNQSNNGTTNNFPIVVIANKLDLLLREVSKPMRGMYFFRIFRSLAERDFGKYEKNTKKI